MKTGLAYTTQMARTVMQTKTIRYAHQNLRQCVAHPRLRGFSDTDTDTYSVRLMVGFNPLEPMVVVYWIMKIMNPSSRSCKGKYTCNPFSDWCLIQ